MFELHDRRTRNVIGYFDTEADALAAVVGEYESNDNTDLLLARVDDLHWSPIASGSALTSLARSALPATQNGPFRLLVLWPQQLRVWRDALLPTPAFSTEMRLHTQQPAIAGTVATADSLPDFVWT